MLARVAEQLYWLARYIERAEGTARLVMVQSNLMLDLPRGYSLGWMPLVEIVGAGAIYPGNARGREREVIQFLLADPDNPGSVLRSLRGARDNARGVREVLPRTAWEQLNGYVSELSTALESGWGRAERNELLQRIIRGAQTFHGVIHGVMSRHDSYSFLRLGSALERADITTRIIDVRSAPLLRDGGGADPFSGVEWMSVLRSLSAHQMYRLQRQTRVNRADVLDFLLRDPQFPRSALFCLREIESRLRTLPRNTPTLRSIARLRRYLGRVQLEELDGAALHKLLDRLQLHLGRLHDRIDSTWFFGEEG